MKKAVKISRSLGFLSTLLLMASSVSLYAWGTADSGPQYIVPNNSGPSQGDPHFNPYSFLDGNAYAILPATSYTSKVTTLGLQWAGGFYQIRPFMVDDSVNVVISRSVKFFVRKIYHVFTSINAP